MNARLAWPAVILALVAMAIAGSMAALHVNPELIVGIVGLLATPVLSALVALQLGQVQGQMTQLASQTNGHQTELLDIVRQQGQALAASTPAESPPAAEQHPAV